ncbi:MAG: hypothetical protein V4502_06150 [Pseudomonadota bacterium]
MGRARELTGKRLTLRQGRRTKRVVIAFEPTGPYIGPMNPKVGDAVLSRDGEWIVAKVEIVKAMLMVPFPGRKAPCPRLSQKVVRRIV